MIRVHWTENEIKKDVPNTQEEIRQGTSLGMVSFETGIPSSGRQKTEKIDNDSSTQIKFPF